MIISRTPFRLSFFGGGTDYPDWYRRHGGEVLSAAVDKYCYITARYLPPFHDHRYRVVYSSIENRQTVDEIRHPAVRAVLRTLGAPRGLEIHHDGDLPARSGMGSSSAFTVGLLNALHALYGRIIDKRRLALQAIDVEQNVIKETVGSQDQVATAYGGVNHIRFAADGEFSVRPVTVGRERLGELERHLLLFYTGVQRTAETVARSYVEDLSRRERQLRALGGMVPDALDLLGGNGGLAPFGALLDESWRVKRELAPTISSGYFDRLYADARAAGAWGGKLVGAGGGGFLMLLAPEDRRQAVRERLGKLLHVPVRFEFSGSAIIFCDYPAEYRDCEPGGRPAGEPS